MKRTLFLSLFLVSFTTLIAQDPGSMSFRDIRKNLLDNRPQSGDSAIRYTSIVNIDQLILSSDPAIAPGAIDFLQSMVRKAILEIENEVLTEGATVWQIYNHGFVVKTQSVCFGMDLDDFKSSIDIIDLADLIDALFISHNHGDHYSPKLISRMNTLGKSVIGPAEESASGTSELMHAGEEKLISKLLVKAHYGLHSKPVRQYEITTPEGIKILHTGDNQTSETIPEINDVNILLLNSWVNESGATSHIIGERIAIAKTKPDVCLPGHILELGHLGGGYIVPYTDVLEVPKTGLPSDFHVLAWGERYHYPNKSNDSIRPNTIENPKYQIKEKSILFTWDTPLPAEDGDTASFYRICFNDNNDLFQTKQQYSMAWDTAGLYQVKVHSYDNCGNQSINPVVIDAIVPDINNSGVGQLRYHGVNIFPNPMKSSTTIRFPNPSYESYRIVLTDLSGKVYRIVDGITASEYVLKKGDLKEGLYFIELRGSKTYRGKIVIE